jgi:hypothetical protein
MTHVPDLARLPVAAALAVTSFVAGIGLGIAFTADDGRRLIEPREGGLPLR